MKVKVQTCWHGGDKFAFRALIGGGLSIFVASPEWNRSVASQMLDLIERETGLSRSSIRFIHV